MMNTTFSLAQLTGLQKTPTSTLQRGKSPLLPSLPGPF